MSNRITVINFEGSSGVGKTTLLNNLHDLLARQGYIVLSYTDKGMPLPLHEDLMHQRGIITVLNSLMTNSRRVIILTDRLFAYTYTDTSKAEYIRSLWKFTRNCITFMFKPDQELFNFIFSSFKGEHPPLIVPVDPLLKIDKMEEYLQGEIEVFINKSRRIEK